MSLKVKAVVNPRSANGQTAIRWPEIEQKLNRSIGAIDAEFTQGIGSATQITRRAIKEGYGHIISIGGDGTLSEVVNGFFEEDKVLQPEVLLSVITQGTGGDFRKSMGLKNNVDTAIKAIAHGSVHPIDIGKMSFVGNDGVPHQVRYFNNIASFGMGGEVDQRVNASAAAKIMGGQGAFLWATLRTMILYTNKKVRLQIDDHFDEQLTIRNVAIANGQYFGGGMWIAPKAKLDDGLFDITIMGDIGRAELLRQMKHYYDGRLFSLPKVQYLQGKKITATCSEEILLDVDGEAPGRLPATFELLPHAIKLKH
ncbi:diacylglycerol kinase family protein [Deltaproteobacteria bacterium TL4]